jgi:hypothetical protein
LLKQKVAKNVAISLGYFIFSKNQNEFSKVAQLAKDCPSSNSLGYFIFKNNQNELSKVAKLEKIFMI